MLAWVSNNKEYRRLFLERARLRMYDVRVINESAEPCYGFVFIVVCSKVRSQIKN